MSPYRSNARDCSHKLVLHVQMDAFVLQQLMQLLPQIADMTRITALQQKLLVSIVNLAMPPLQSLKTIDAILKEVC